MFLLFMCVLGLLFGQTVLLDACATAVGENIIAENMIVDKREPAIYKEFLTMNDLEWERISQNYLEQEAKLQANDLAKFVDPENKDSAFNQAKNYLLELSKEGCPIVACNLGILHHRVGNLDSAYNVYFHAMGILEAGVNFGAILLQRGDLKGAEYALKQAAKKDVLYDDKSLYNLGLVYSRMNDEAKHERFMKRAALKRRYAIISAEMVHSNSETFRKRLNDKLAEHKKALETPFEIED